MRINEQWIDRLGQVLDSYEHGRRSSSFGSIWSSRHSARAPIWTCRRTMSTAAVGRPGAPDRAQDAALYSRIEQSALVSIAEMMASRSAEEFELALACDIEVASDAARVGLPEARHGLLPGAGDLSG